MATRANGKDTFSHDICAKTAEAFRNFCDMEGIIQRHAIERTLHLFMALAADQRRFVMRGREEDYRRWLAQCEVPPVPDHADAELEEAAKHAEREQADKQARRRKG